MRPAFQDFELIYSEDSALPTVIGISLGYDHTAEHEWGIESLKQLLKMPVVNIEAQKKKINKKLLGINSRIIHSTESIWTGEFVKAGTTYYYLYAGPIYSKERENRIVDTIQRQFGSRLEKMIEKSNVATAWSDSDLCFVTDQKGLPEFFIEEIQKKNVFLGVFGGRNPFANGSLMLFVASEIPQQLKEDMLKADLEKIETLREDDRTGIKEKLAKKQSEWQESHPHCFHTPWSYIALSPRIHDDDWPTQHRVVYWLNPDNQDLVNYGWYTVEELEDWISEKPNNIVSAENWPKLKWQCKHHLFSMLKYEYKDFLPVSPEYYSSTHNGKTVIKIEPDNVKQNLEVIVQHILMLYCRDIKDQIEFAGKPLEDISSSREQDRVFGFCEAMSLIGLGGFGAVNTPKSASNFSWLCSILWTQAWFLVAKETGLITEEDEKTFLTE